MEVGQTVYCEPGINMSRRRGNEIIEGTIEKIARKYVYINFGGYNTIKFYKDNLEQVTDYAPDYIVYLTKEEILEKREYEQLTTEVRKCFDFLGGQPKHLTLDKLRRIKDIIDED